MKNEETFIPKFKFGKTIEIEEFSGLIGFCEAKSNGDKPLPRRGPGQKTTFAAENPIW